jgi:hypothetical protein
VGSADRPPAAGVALALVAAALAAGPGCDDSRLAASRYVKRMHVLASTGGVIEITADESRELAGTRLIIGPGALAVDTTITVELRSRPVARSPAGPVVAFGPPGTELRSDARLALPADTTAAASGEPLILEAQDEDGQRWILSRRDMAVDVTGALGHVNVRRLAAFQIGRWPMAPCLAVVFSEGGRPVAQSRSVLSPPPLPRRRAMISRATLVGALAASCALTGCQEPPDSPDQSADQLQAAHADPNCLPTCLQDARQAFQRCLEAGSDSAACSARHSATIDSCIGTCGAPCPPRSPVPPPPPTPPRFPPPPAPPVPAPPPPAVPPLPPECVRMCRDQALEEFDRCVAAGRDAAVCRDRQVEVDRACLRRCVPPAPVPPPPPVPPPAPPAPAPPPPVVVPPVPPPAPPIVLPPPVPPAPPPPSPECARMCRSQANQQLDDCTAAGRDANVCRTSAEETERACLQACRLPPPAPPSPCQRQCLETASEDLDRCIARGTDATTCRNQVVETQRDCLAMCEPPGRN